MHGHPEILEEMILSIGFSKTHDAAFQKYF